MQQVDLARAVRDAIFSLGVSGGTPLTEQKLAKRFGVSRTPVRDVLRDLEKGGVIERRQRSGVSLRKPSPKELSEVYDVRAILEGYAARLAAVNASRSDLKELTTYARQFTRARKQGDSQACERANIAFHGKIVELAGNDLLRGMMDRFNIIRRAFWLTHSLSVDERDQTTPYPHEAIVEKLQAGDADGSEELVKAHIRRAKNILIEKSLGVKLDLDGKP